MIYNGSSGADNLSGIGGYANRINGLGGNDNISDPWDECGIDSSHSCIEAITHAIRSRVG